MQDFEKLGVFYLGKHYDLAAKKVQDDLLLYESKDLTTHAVCVGMTGSGKTGLCLDLLEEAAIDGIPAIAIDPKGDLGNLLLTFPDLKPSDFRPWLDPADAERKGLSLDELAERTAKQSSEGLAAWGQDPARIAKFRDSVDTAIYTPGSSAGLSLTILRSFAAPPAALLADGDALRERIMSAVSGLLALLGIDADPLRSREHILLSNIFDRAWRAGHDIDLGGLIHDIQTPPFAQVGVVPLDSFFPEKDRSALSMKLNNLLASPGFAAWMTGEPLDIQRLLFTTSGKPRLSIISIAHLSDAERMFFLTILLNELIAWMRTQSGTSSLRALLYMDEVFGYFPPSANPPTKLPMLTLLKQARAFGLGVVLATQNPVDLDYKGLSNAGTWFLGRLQTERDKARVLDGLEGASAQAGAAFDRGRMEKILSALGARVFLMNNVHEDQPVVFQSRWALSFLCGPLGRDKIQTLMASRKASTAAAIPAATATSSGQPTAAQPAPLSAASQRPVLPPAIVQFFVPSREKLPPDSRLVYRPALLGSARVHFAQASLGVDVWQTAEMLLAIEGDGDEFVWDGARALDDAPELEKEPETGATFASLPAALARPKTYSGLETALKELLYRTRKLQIWKSKSLKQVSGPDESEGDFRARLAHGAREQRDEQVEKLRTKYAPKLAALEEQRRKAQQRLDKQKSEAKHQTLQTILSVGQSVLAAVFSRKLTSAANVQRMGTTMRAASKISKEQGDVQQAEETVEAFAARKAELESQLKQESDQLQESASPESIPLEAATVQPKKSDIAVTRVVLVWKPHALSAEGTARPL
jgi:hypothetical protein